MVFLKNLFEILYESYQRNPEKIYIQEDGNMYTYADVYKSSLNMAEVLVNTYHIHANDYVLIYIENSVEYVIGFFAILYIGAIAVPLNRTLGVELFQLVFEETNSRYMLLSKQLLGRAKRNLPDQIQTIIVQKEFKEFDYSIDRNDSVDVAMIIYTSGTTAKAKGVMLTHQNLLANTDSILAYLPITENSSILAIMSFTYSYGNSILLTHTKAGACIEICNMSAYPQKVLDHLEKVNSFSTVGSYLNTLVKQKNFTVSKFQNLDYMTFAGEATSYDLVLSLQRQLPKVKFYIMYGQTEASARISYLNPNLIELKKGSVGKAIQGDEIKVVDDNGNELAAYENGEIVVSGRNIMKGYMNDPELTNQTIRNGWLHTGDIAYKDQEGYVYIIGRSKDIIKKNGFRISPVEIESAINLHKDVVESAVVEAYDDSKQTIIKAYVVFKDSNYDLKDLQAFLASKLSPLKRPQLYEAIESIPKTLNGKIQRIKLSRGI